MGAVPTTDNKLADFLRGVINALVTGGENAAEAYVTALDPAILALPPIKFIIDEVLQELGSVLTEQIGNGLVKITIDIQTNGEKSGVVQAATALQYAEASGDGTSIQSAKQHLMQEWANAIHSDGSSPPDAGNGT